MFEPNHLHLIIKAQQVRQLTTVNMTKEFLSDVIAAADMKVISGPYAEMVDEPGNDGPTGAAILATSHCAVHSWPQRKLMQACIYSCCEFEVDAILEVFRQFGNGTLEYMLVDRNNDIEVKHQSIKMIHGEP